MISLLHFALMLLHFGLVLHFAAIVITFCVSITFYGDYYILRRNSDAHVVAGANERRLYSQANESRTLVFKPLTEISTLTTNTYLNQSTT